MCSLRLPPDVCGRRVKNRDLDIASEEMTISLGILSEHSHAYACRNMHTPRLFLCASTFHFRNKSIRSRLDEFQINANARREQEEFINV